MYKMRLNYLLLFIGVVSLMTTSVNGIPKATESLTRTALKFEKTKKII